VKIWDTHSKLQQSKKKAGKKFCSQAQEISCTTGVLKKKKKTEENEQHRNGGNGGKRNFGILHH
jgi:hypothetical protein